MKIKMKIAGMKKEDEDSWDYPDDDVDDIDEDEEDEEDPDNAELALLVR